MKIKSLVILALSIGYIGFSQTDIVLKGKVGYEDFGIANVEVVNSNSKKMTITDSDGNFSIGVRVNDMLVFVSKNYKFKQVLINQTTFEKCQINISLTKKITELDEVLITKMPVIKISKDKKWEQEKRDQLAIEKAAKNKKPLNVYDGTIENGANLMRIGGMIAGLFVKDKANEKKHIAEVDFKVLVKKSIGEKYYQENLKLKPHEIDLFIEFCKADPKSKTLLKDSNILSLMDFLMMKNIEFKKLETAY